MKIFNHLLFAFVFVSLSAFANEQEHGEHKPDFFPKKQADKTLSARPAVPQLLEPKALSLVSGGQVSLKWAPVETAESYRLQVATDPNFKWLVTQQDFYKNTSFDLTGLEAGKHYFWRVYAWKTNNEPGFTSSFPAASSFDAK